MGKFSVCCRMQVEFFIWTKWNSPRLFEHFGRTLRQNFIWIRSQTKKFPIDLYSKIYVKFAHRPHCKNPADFYNGGLWANFLSVVGFKWNFASEFVQNVEITGANFILIGWKISEISRKIQLQTNVKRTVDKYRYFEPSYNWFLVIWIHYFIQNNTFWVSELFIWLLEMFWQPSLLWSCAFIPTFYWLKWRWSSLPLKFLEIEQFFTQ